MESPERPFSSFSVSNASGPRGQFNMQGLERRQYVLMRKMERLAEEEYKAKQAAQQADQEAREREKRKQEAETLRIKQRQKHLVDAKNRQIAKKEKNASILAEERSRTEMEARQKEMRMSRLRQKKLEQFKDLSKKREASMNERSKKLQNINERVNERAQQQMINIMENETRFSRQREMVVKERNSEVHQRHEMGILKLKRASMKKKEDEEKAIRKLQEFESKQEETFRRLREKEEERKEAANRRRIVAEAHSSTNRTGKIKKIETENALIFEEYEKVEAERLHKHKLSQLGKTSLRSEERRTRLQGQAERVKELEQIQLEKERILVRRIQNHEAKVKARKEDERRMKQMAQDIAKQEKEFMEAYQQRTAVLSKTLQLNNASRVKETLKLDLHQKYVTPRAPLHSLSPTETSPKRRQYSTSSKGSLSHRETSSRSWRPEDYALPPSRNTFRSLSPSNMSLPSSNGTQYATASQATLPPSRATIYSELEPDFK